MVRFSGLENVNGKDAFLIHIPSGLYLGSAVVNREKSAVAKPAASAQTRKLKDVIQKCDCHSKRISKV